VSDVKVVAKNESGSIWIVALRGAKVGVFTPTVIYRPGPKDWSEPKYLGSFMKFIPLVVKHYDDVIANVPEKISSDLRKFRRD
jgi:hypothetical protein